MKKKLFFIFSDKYLLFLFFIFILSVFFRFYNFSHSWGLGSDDIRDISIAKEALARGELPLIGSFSSAGPFVFGPLFYWFIMLSYLVLPLGIIAPWVMLTIVGIVTVFLLIYLANLVGGKGFSIIVGLLAATSPQLINRSISLNQHSLIGVTTVLLILSYVLLWQRRKIIYSFLMGLSLGVALSMHYQAINLIIFFPFLFLIPKINFKEKILSVMSMFVGFIIPSLPLLIWDSHQEFANIRNILDYLLIAQYRLYVPNSWRLFLFDYLPNYWRYVAGGYFPISLILMFLIGAIFSILLLFRRNTRTILVLGLAFILLIIINRYYHGERFEGYMMYLTPFTIFFSAFALERLIFLNTILPDHKINANKKNLFIFSRLFGYVLLLSVISGNILYIKNNILTKDNRINEIIRVETTLIHRYPNQKFSLYDYKWQSSDQSYPLSAFLKEKDKTDKKGVPIGIIWGSITYPKKLKVITTIQKDLVVDLQNDSSLLTNQSKWVNVNRERIYDDLMRWSKTMKLKSNFSLSKYILERIKIL